MLPHSVFFENGGNKKGVYLFKKFIKLCFETKNVVISYEINSNFYLYDRCCFKNGDMKRFLVITILLFVYCGAQTQDIFENRDFQILESLDILQENIDAVVYPNPVRDGKFYVSSSYSITSIEVLNVIGQRIVKKDFNAYNVQEIMVELLNCEQGLYLVKISFINDKTIIKKLLVK